MACSSSKSSRSFSCSAAAVRHSVGNNMRRES
jgi:hypothetical protein